MTTPKLKNLKEWMTEDEQEVLREAAASLLERSADDFQLAVEALISAQVRKARMSSLSAGEEAFVQRTAERLKAPSAPTDTERLDALEPILRNNGLDYTERHGGFATKWGNFGFALEPVATLRGKADQLIAAEARNPIVDAEVTA